MAQPPKKVTPSRMAQPPKKPVDKKPRFGVEGSTKPKTPKDKQSLKDAKQLADSLNSSSRAEAGDDALMKGNYKKGGKVKSCKMKCGGKVKGKK